LMSREKTIHFDQITRRVAKHFKNEDEMRRFLLGIYQETEDPTHPAHQTADPVLLERRKMIEECPAVVLLGDLTDLRNFLLHLGRAERPHDGLLDLRMPVEQSRIVWRALKALKKLAEHRPGPAIVYSLASLIPAEAEKQPNKLARHILKVLEG